MISKLLILLQGKGRNSSVSLQKYEQSISLQKYDKVVQQFWLIEIEWLISFNRGVKPKNFLTKKLVSASSFTSLNILFQPVKFPFKFHICRVIEINCISLLCKAFIEFSHIFCGSKKTRCMFFAMRGTHSTVAP